MTLDKKALIKLKRRTVASKIPQGRYCYAIYATTDGKRERHSHFLTKPEAQNFAKALKTESARRHGFKNVRIINDCKKGK